MAGNRTGGKVPTLYYTDNVDVAYVLNRDTDLVFAGLGNGALAPEEYDPEDIPAGVIITPAPRRFKPRVIFIQSSSDRARKELIAFHPNSELYQATFRQQMPEIDGDTSFFSTGRKGEKLSF